MQMPRQRELGAVVFASSQLKGMETIRDLLLLQAAGMVHTSARGFEVHLRHTISSMIMGNSLINTSVSRFPQR